MVCWSVARLICFAPAGQHLYFLCIDITIRSLSMFEITSFLPSSLAAQAGLCQTWSENPKTSFSCEDRFSCNEAHK